MEYSIEIAEAIKNILTQDEMNFDFNSAKGMFKFNANISGKITRLSYVIAVRKRDFIVYAMCPVKADSEDSKLMAEMSEFLTRVNYNLINGNFEMSYKNGNIDFKMFHYCGNTIPDDSILKICILISMKAFQKYSKGILGIASGTMTGEQAYDLCKD
ncbi:MAG: YbjN domain-containing protein [Ruminococcus sp.]|nr:YbjN domain-containing protein [Ruminococcus sp.]